MPTRLASPTHCVSGAISKPLAGLALRMFLATSLVTALALLIALVVTGRRASKAADANLRQGLEATRTAIDDALAARSASLERVAMGLAGVPAYVARVNEAIRNGQRAELLDQADEFRSQLDAGWVLITDQVGTVQAWTRDRDRAGDPLGGALIEGALAGTPMSGTWIEPTPQGDSMFQAVAVPLLEPGGQTPQGVMVAALPIDSALAARLTRQTGSEVAFLIEGNEALQQMGKDRAGKAGMAGEDSVARVVEITRDGQQWLGITGPLRTAGGEVVGEFVGLRSRASAMAAFSGFRTAIQLAFLAALATAVAVSVAVSRRVTRPVRQLVAATRDVSEGRFTGALPMAGDDEIGELTRAFDRMVRDLKAKDDLVAMLSQARRSGPHRAEGATPLTGRLREGDVVADRYKVLKVVGQGGMGTVHRAEDLELGEQVALKTLDPMLAHDPNTLSRFKQEIRLARRITHRNVVRTHDIGEADGLLFLTMEFVEGASLRQLLEERKKLHVPVVRTLGRQLCRALQAAHEQGVIHRDVKPENLLVADDGTLKVTDFGIATLLEQDRPALTGTGQMIGTLRYMAPEQVEGQPVDARTDLYAAGAVLFECLTGREVFPSAALGERIIRITDEPAPDPRSLDGTIPREMAEAVVRALAKRKDDRWVSASAMREAIERDL